MNRFKKVKKSIAENAEMVVYGTLVAGVCSLYAYAIYAAMQQIKYDNEQASKNNQMLQDAIAAGKTILPNTDGSFWIIDNNK